MIVLFILTRNEADLLRLNLAHHLGWGFDHIAVADNDSTDATQDVIREFGDTVSSTRIVDPYERYSALSRLLHAIEDRHGSVAWCAVSDTDEFWWAPDTDPRRLLEPAAEGTVAVNSGQKLFLPTELDPVVGPVYCRRTYRTSSPKSSLHTSHRAGKSLYRGAWLRCNVVTNPHWSADVPHSVIRFDRPLVHHYMIDGEDSFIDKVRSLERWNPGLRRDAAASEQQTAKSEKSSPTRDFKFGWWNIYKERGEAGLREYYRTEYLISRGSLDEHLRSGDLVQDPQFANFKRSKPDA